MLRSTFLASVCGNSIQQILSSTGHNVTKKHIICLKEGDNTQQVKEYKLWTSLKEMWHQEVIQLKVGIDDRRIIFHLIL